MKLIVLYGYMSDEHNGKTQRLIDGEMTCGYREYAKNGGCILYASPQSVNFDWEYTMTDPSEIVDFCHSYPDAVVFSVKVNRSKNRVLAAINNFKIHYSCQGKNMVNEQCDVSLVDTQARMFDPRCRLYVKGKDPEYWLPSDNKQYDYLIMGRRDDKNQTYFLKRLNEIKSPRSALWIGGYKFRKKVKTHHNITYTKVLPPDEVRDQIPLARVGVLFSQIKTEGFPQSFLEMTMCGVPVVYGGPSDNPNYFFEENSRRPKKSHIISAAEELLASHSSGECRRVAVENYSIQKSIERMLSYK